LLLFEKGNILPPFIFRAGF